MSIIRFSGKPHFRLFVHPDQTVVARADGRFVMRNLVGDWKTPYRTDTEWHCRLMDALQGGASFAGIRDAIRPLLDEEQTTQALEQINDLFLGEVVVVKLAPQGSGPLVALAPHGVAYTPQFAPVADAEKLALSRFAMLRREEGRVLLETALKPYHLLSETPEADALLGRFLRGVRVSEVLSQWPAPAREPLRDLLALLKHDGILLAADQDSPGRRDEGAALAQWDVHDLWMHGASRLGYTQMGYGEFGGVFPNIGRYEPRPAVRPAWSGERIALAKPDMEELYKSEFPALAGVQDYRRSVREYNEEQPLPLEQLGHLLYRACRVTFRDETEFESPLADVDGKAKVEFAWRPYPTGGASYELEVYLSADRCAGLDSGFYHYDAERHCLVRIAGRTPEVEELLHGAYVATGYQAKPQVVLHIAARFQRVAWKYRAIAYSVILKNAGVLYQTLYLVATAMGIAPCGLGSGNIELFRRITGLDPMVEGSVGDFGLGSLPAGYHDRLRR